MEINTVGSGGGASKMGGVSSVSHWHRSPGPSIISAAVARVPHCLAAAVWRECRPQTRGVVGCSPAPATALPGRAKQQASSCEFHSAPQLLPAAARAGLSLQRDCCGVRLSCFQTPPLGYSSPRARYSRAIARAFSLPRKYNPRQLSRHRRKERRLMALRAIAVRP